MKSETARIRDQLRRAFEGDAWHGPSVNEALGYFDETSAWTRVSPSVHTAVELVLHTAAWIEIGRERLEGHTVDVGPERDWEDAGEPDARRWREAVERLDGAYEALDATLAARSDAWLDEQTPGRGHSNYVLAHGLVQHCLYHAGQLMVLRRLVAGEGTG